MMGESFATFVGIPAVKIMPILRVKDEKEKYYVSIVLPTSAAQREVASKCKMIR